MYKPTSYTCQLHKYKFSNGKSWLIAHECRQCKSTRPAGTPATSLIGRGPVCQTVKGRADRGGTQGVNFPLAKAGSGDDETDFVMELVRWNALLDESPPIVNRFQLDKHSVIGAFITPQI